MNKKSLEKFLNRKVKLVKDDNFVISGEIKDVFDDSIEFFTDGKLIILAFSRIGEISPLKHVNNRGGNHS